jgi:hypothetical protein
VTAQPTSSRRDRSVMPRPTARDDVEEGGRRLRPAIAGAGSRFDDLSPGARSRSRRALLTMLREDPGQAPEQRVGSGGRPRTRGDMIPPRDRPERAAPPTPGAAHLARGPTAGAAARCPVGPGSWMTARRRIRSPQRGHASGSTPNTRWRSCAHDSLRGRGRGAFEGCE